MKIFFLGLIGAVFVGSGISYAVMTIVPLMIIIGIYILFTSIVMLGEEHSTQYKGEE